MQFLPIRVSCIQVIAESQVFQLTAVLSDPIFAEKMDQRCEGGGPSPGKPNVASKDWGKWMDRETKMQQTHPCVEKPQEPLR